MNVHGKQWHKGKTRSRPIAERFWEKVDKRGPDECWPWVGSLDVAGRAQIWWQGRVQRASRVAMFVTTGEALPEGMFACHTCDNPICVNPKHLFAGTASDNQKDRVAKGRGGQSWPRKPPFTDEQNADVVRQYEAGKSILRIAESFGVSERRIALLLKRAGVAWRGRRQRRAAASPSEPVLCDACGKDLDAESTAAAENARCHRTLGCSRERDHGGDCTPMANQPGDPTIRHVVAWMRQTYPQNQHAREWANEIERVFLRGAAATPVEGAACRMCALGISKYDEIHEVGCSEYDPSVYRTGFNK